MSNIIGKLTAADQTSDWFHWKGGLCTLWFGIRDAAAGTDHYDFGGNTVSIECADEETATGARALPDSAGDPVTATANKVLGLSLAPCYLRIKTTGGAACDVGVKAVVQSGKV